MNIFETVNILTAHVCITALTFLIIANIKDLKAYLNKKDIMILSLFVILGAYLRYTYTTPAHMIFNDESEYVFAARTIYEKYRLVDYSKSIGWPAFISLFFTFMPIKLLSVFYINLIIGSLTVIPFYMLLRSFGLSSIQSSFAPFFLVLSPLHIAWSTAAKNNHLSIFAILMTLFFAKAFLNKVSIKLFLLVIISTCFSALIRPENYILFPVLFLGFWYIFKKRSNHFIKYLPLFLILSLLCVVNLLTVYEFQTSVNWLETYDDPGFSGANWSLSNLWNNTFKYIPKILFGKDQPSFIALCAFLGLPIGLKKYKNLSVYCVTYFLIFSLIYFYSYFQIFGGKDRFYMTFYIPIFIFASFFFIEIISKLKSKSIFIGLLYPAFALIHYPYIKKMPYFNHESNILQSELPQRLTEIVKNHCTVYSLSTLPIKVTTNFKTQYLENYNPMHNQQNSCEYFLEDKFCFDWNQDGLSPQCEGFKKKYLLKEVKTFRYKSEKFTLYKIINRQKEYNDN